MANPQYARDHFRKGTTPPRVAVKARVEALLAHVPWDSRQTSDAIREIFRGRKRPGAKASTLRRWEIQRMKIREEIRLQRVQAGLVTNRKIRRSPTFRRFPHAKHILDV